VPLGLDDLRPLDRCRDEHERDVGGVGRCAQGVAELVAVELGHGHVAEDEVGPRVADEREPFFAVDREAHVVTAVTHRGGDELSDHRIVLAEHDLRHLATPYTLATATRGRVNWKTDPSPSVLSTHARPPCISTICREIGRPSPVPWMYRVAPDSSRE
jgi:hypothetical protein